MDHPLVLEIQTVKEQWQLGNITAEEKDYLLKEIRDIRAAQECAGDEVMFRYVYQTCNLIISMT